MAEQPIKGTDIIENGLFNDAVKQADLFLVKIKELEEGIKENLKTSKDYLNTWSANGSKSLSNNAKLTADVTKELKNLEALEQQRIKTEIAKQNLLNASERALKSQIQTEQQFEKALANETKELNKSSEANKRKTNELTQAKKQLKELSDRVELNTFKIKQNAIADTESGRTRARTAKLVADEQKKLYETITQVEQGVGRFQRNVGNYASGFDSLGNSVNQLTRELPAFAVSMNTGFLAISNNLPIFFDQLQKINAENKVLLSQGKPVQSVFSKLSGAIFSAGTALSLGVTLLTLFGGKLVTLIGNLFDSADAFDLNKESLGAFNDEIERNKELQDDLQNNINTISKSILVNSKAITDVEGKVLDAYDNLQNKQAETERKRIASVSNAIVKQLKNGDEEVKIAVRNAKNYVEIENTKTNEIIRLDKSGKKILSNYSAFYNKEIVTINEKALQAKINQVNKEDEIVQRLLNNELDATLKNIYFIDKAEEESKKKKEKRVKELIDLTDRIIKLNIENESDTKQRAINMAKFEERVAIDEVSKLNATEKQKELLKTSIRIDTYNKLIAIDELYAKKEIDKINDKFKTDNDIAQRNVDAAIDNTRSLNEFRLWELEKQLDKEKDKKEKASKEELKRLKTEILEKKKLIIQKNADDEKTDKTEFEKQVIQEKADREKKKLQYEFDNEKDIQDKDAEFKRQLAFSQKLIDAIAKAEAEKSRLKVEAFDKEISQQEKNIETQRNLAQRGLANTLAEEEARKVQLERQKEEEKLKEIKRQKALAFFKLFSSYAEKDPNTALQNALKDTIIAEAVAGAFIDGTENVERDLKGSKVHNGTDGYVIAVDGRERILNPEQNKLVGNLSNEALADLAYKHNNGLLETAKFGVIPTNDFATNIANSALLMETMALRKEMQSIKEVIKNRPTTNFNFDGYGDFIKETIEGGFNKRTTYKQPKPRI